MVGVVVVVISGGGEIWSRVSECLCSSERSEEGGVWLFTVMAVCIERRSTTVVDEEAVRWPSSVKVEGGFGGRDGYC